MKLIDADKLIETVNKYAKNIQFEHLADWLTFLEIIDEQPTAFDVEIVIEQIKNLKNEVSDIYHVDEAVEIVKAGGIDDN